MSVPMISQCVVLMFSEVLHEFMRHFASLDHRVLCGRCNVLTWSIEFMVVSSRGVRLIYIFFGAAVVYDLKLFTARSIHQGHKRFSDTSRRKTMFF